MPKNKVMKLLILKQCAKFAGANEKDQEKLASNEGWGSAL